MIDFIRENLTQEELLAQLAEEAAELAHAALKMRRAYGNTENPTPVSSGEAFRNLTEELADVQLCITVLGFAPLIKHDVARIKEQKLTRWANRIKAAQLWDARERGSDGEV